MIAFLLFWVFFLTVTLNIIERVEGEGEHPTYAYWRARSKNCFAVTTIFMSCNLNSHYITTIPSRNPDQKAKFAGNLLGRK